MKKLIISTIFALLLSLNLWGKTKPNLIFISVDTLRQDHLGIYGYHRNTSPNIDRLLSRGVWFTNAHCNVPLTNPSFCSMMTSRYPHEIGATRNGIPMVRDALTLAEILKENGYTTVAFLSNWPLKAHLSNLDQGFDIYDDNFSKKRWLFFNDERDARGVTEQATNWLKNQLKEPFFLWAHYSEPHAPYLSHKGFRFSDPNLPDTEEQRRIDAYDSEIAYADHYIGELVNCLSQLGLLENSLVFFVADHGESLGEHSYVGHGRYLYEPSMRIPFGLSGPGIPRGVRIDAQVELLDLAPTFLAYAGIPIPPQMRGRNLLPYIRGEKPWQEPYLVYFETYPGAVRGEGMEKLASLKKPIWVGLKVENLKVLYSVPNSRWEMYQIQQDPKELHNLADPTNSVFIQFSEKVLGWWRGWKDTAVVGSTTALTEEDKKKLEALGYLNK